MLKAQEDQICTMDCKLSQNSDDLRNDPSLFQQQLNDPIYREVIDALNDKIVVNNPVAEYLWKMQPFLHEGTLLGIPGNDSCYLQRLVVPFEKKGRNNAAVS